MCNGAKSNSLPLHIRCFPSIARASLAILNWTRYVKMYKKTTQTMSAVIARVLSVSLCSRVIGVVIDGITRDGSYSSHCVKPEDDEKLDEFSDSFSSSGRLTS